MPRKKMMFKIQKLILSFKNVSAFKRLFSLLIKQ